MMACCLFVDSEKSRNLAWGIIMPILLTIRCGMFDESVFDFLPLEVSQLLLEKLISSYYKR